MKMRGMNIPGALVALQLGWAAVAHTVAADSPLYKEIYRPQFHFTAQSNWLNDPNGLVFYKGEYHLYFQHNPQGTEWGNMTWGHAISPDLVHWKQLDHALMPDRLGTMFSGSGAVDVNNSAGFQTGREKTLVFLYTAAGGTSPESEGKPFSQCLAYSTDRGRTLVKYEGNPVLTVRADHRDPKVFWHQPTKKWIMALYVPMLDETRKNANGQPETVHTLQYFSSDDLKKWTFLSRMDGIFECPDTFELPVDGKKSNTRWVAFGADGEYLIGNFDGRVFSREADKHIGDYGANYYAAQTYSDIPANDGRRIIVGWMRGGKYPHMPFNQQMAFPCELSLRTTPEGLRLCKWPVKEIANLVTNKLDWKRVKLAAGVNPLEKIHSDCLDIEAVIEPCKASEVRFDVRGTVVVWSAAKQELSALGRTGPLPLRNGRIALRLLVDRTSVEIFGNHGEMVMSSCFVPPVENQSLGLSAQEGAGAPARVVSMTVRELNSAWEP
jgi:sucrose-6-phosphate hydrolase SacC (GH32 family)